MYNFSVYVSDEIIYLPVSSIHLNTYRARKITDPHYLDSLADSIRNFGLLQPVAVRDTCLGYELIFGECRLKAAKIAGLDTIPTVVLSVSDRDAAVLALAENINRSELTYMERSDALASISEDFECSAKGLSHLLAKDVSYVAEGLAINDLDKTIKNELFENGLDTRYACELLKIKDKKTQEEVLGKVKKYGLNIKRTRSLVENIVTAGKNTQLFNINMRKKSFDDTKLFFNTIKQAVDMLRSYGLETGYSVDKSENGYEITVKCCGQ